MKITLKRTDEQVELLQSMASRNREEAYAAQTTLAQLLAPVVSEVIDNAPTLSNLFTDLPYNQEDNPSLPADLFFDDFDEDYIRVFSQSVPGGLPSNELQPTSAEMKFTTYNLDSAVSFDKKYAQRSRLDVVSKTMTKIMQEVMRKQERTSANIIMAALANAATGKQSFSALNRHVFRSAQANRFLLDDLNKLFTKMKRINSSFLGGTPVGGRGRLTDLLVSPEIIENIRSFSYNPINTVAPNGAAVGATSQPVTLTDNVRSQLFSQSGLTDFYGVSITEVSEMGIGFLFNEIFDTLAGTTDFLDHGSTSASSAFDGAAEELVIGLDRNRESLIRPIALDSETGSRFSLMADDQFSMRQSKIGYWGGLEEGRVVLDVRSLVGLIV